MRGGSIMEQEHDPLAHKNLSNAYDPMFAQRIAALGGARPSQPPPAPRPQQSGGAGGGVLAAIVVVSLCARFFIAGTHELSSPPQRRVTDIQSLQGDWKRIHEQQRLLDEPTRTRPVDQQFDQRLLDEKRRR